VIETGTRAERKERTRRAILDAALELTKSAPLAAVSIRQLARQAGIQAPSFYGHFDSIDAVGLALVDESFTSLREALVEVRRGVLRGRDMVRPSVTALTDQARAKREQFSFLARERYAGSTVIRQSIRAQLALIEADLALDLARLLPPSWPNEDLRLASRLVVLTVVDTFAELVIDEPAGPEELLDQTLRLLYRQVRAALKRASA